MENFKASVKYGDLKGSSAADHVDMHHETLKQWLISEGKMADNEHVIGIKLNIGENHGVHQDPVMATFLVSDLKGYADIPTMLDAMGDNLEVKVIREDMNIVDFLKFFKRLEISLSSGGILEGKQFTLIAE